MDAKIKECLENKEFDYILPFFWQHGEEHQVLLEEMEAIRKCGIKSFCVESRTHEQFCEDKWWLDFGFILKKAKETGMKVWLLDDKHFPTGYANNAMEKKYPHLKQRHFRTEVVDVMGPRKDLALLTDFYTNDGDRLLRAVAYKRTGEGLDCDGEGIDLTPTYEDSLVRFDVPEGMWRVFFIVFSIGKGARPHYVDMLNPEATDVMISEIYQPHYDHFKEYFGNTLVGFFSDEPGFNQEIGSYFCSIGKAKLLPYCDSLIPEIAAKLGVGEDEVWRLAPGLWWNVGEKTAAVRVAYMDVVTRMYAENFTEKLAGWSNAHGVMYIGHIIEDMNASMHLGHSAGNYFRALDAEDMAGIDVVLHQVMPGQNEMMHTARIYDRIADPTFFVYALAKLAASHSHINPKMKNRAMCEIFGAYGFAEGLPFMKKLADHFLASGINRYVPHAFTPKYPDRDCPPHFWCRGMNPQFTLFGELMRYMQRVIHALDGSAHVADALVYYNAESEWSGGKTLLYFDVSKRLTQAQIDFDFISQDYALITEYNDGKLVLNGNTYRALVLPGCEYITSALDEKLVWLAKAGAKIVFAGDVPKKTSDGKKTGIASLAMQTPLDELGDFFRASFGTDIKLSTDEKYVRVYHVKRDALDVYMFKNDSEETVCTAVEGISGDIAVYDAWSNAYFKKFDAALHLVPGESAIWVAGEDVSGLPEFREWYRGEEKALDLLWDCDAQSVEDGVRRPVFTAGKLTNLAARGGLTRFSGKLFYSAEFEISGALPRFIDLGYVGETADVKLNGSSLGAKIAPPYVFEIGGAVREGSNRIGIEVVTNPVYRERDDFSRYMPILPMGLTGEVKLIY
ncbi:MAG: hypothetical protein IJV00_05635 [Clostridia bacterium]|nr:hypothetical protein [Clostridia bacterium]